MAHLITPIIWQKLVSMIRRRGAGVDAEDLVQEAYARLLNQSLTTEVVNPEGFVLRAATNLAITAYRERTRRDIAHADAAVSALLHPQCVTQHEVMEARERLAIVERAIATLPPRARQVFVLHRIEGLKYVEIARSLGISVSAVEKNMARALTHLTMEVQQFGQRRDRRR